MCAALTSTKRVASVQLLLSVGEGVSDDDDDGGIGRRRAGLRDAIVGVLDRVQPLWRCGNVDSIEIWVSRWFIVCVLGFQKPARLRSRLIEPRSSPTTPTPPTLNLTSCSPPPRAFVATTQATTRSQSSHPPLHRQGQTVDALIGARPSIRRRFPGTAQPYHLHLLGDGERQSRRWCGRRPPRHQRTRAGGAHPHPPAADAGPA